MKCPSGRIFQRGDLVSSAGYLKTGEIKKLAPSGKFKLWGVVARINSRKDKNDRTFWDLALMDEEGQIEGKAWANSQWFDRQDPNVKDKFLDEDQILNIEGKTVGVQGQVVEFRGQPQYNFNAIYYVHQGEYPPHDFVQKSPVPVMELENSFNELLDISNGQINDFLRHVFSGNLYKVFKVAPAAVAHHHAYVHGLLEHTVRVTSSARAIAESYIKGGYPVELDYVIAGGLLHDLGKIDAYLLNPAPGISVPGFIHDHIALGYAKLSDLARDFGLNERAFLHLGHILLSHHGCKEFGSPVLPATLEAMIISSSDELDFKLFCYKNSVENLDAGQDISEFNNSTGRRFWNWNNLDAYKSTTESTIRSGQDK